MAGRPRTRLLASVLALLVGIGGAVAAPAASAQPPDPRHRAEAPLREGLELAKAGKTEAALAKFEAAYALSPSGPAVYQIARMEQLLGRHALALQHFREALRDATLGVEPRRDAERAIADLKSKIGVLTFDVPGGATTTVDGNEVDPTSALEVVPGLHLVKVRLASETRSIDVQAPAGAVTPVKVRFGEPAPPPAASTSPVTVAPLPEHPGYWTTGRIVGAGLFGAGLAGVATGLAFQAAASSAADDADNVRRTLPGSPESVCGDPANRSRCTELQGAVDDQNSANDLRAGFLVAGGALLIGGAVLFLVSAPAKERSAAWIAPAIGKTSGLVLGGRF